jgi:hypothetical protein
MVTQTSQEDTIVVNEVSDYFASIGDQVTIVDNLRMGVVDHD